MVHFIVKSDWGYLLLLQIVFPPWMKSSKEIIFSDLIWVGAYPKSTWIFRQTEYLNFNTEEMSEISISVTAKWIWNVHAKRPAPILLPGHPYTPTHTPTETVKVCDSRSPGGWQVGREAGGCVGGFRFSSREQEMFADTLDPSNGHRNAVAVKRLDTGLLFSLTCLNIWLLLHMLGIKFFFITILRTWYMFLGEISPKNTFFFLLLLILKFCLVEFLLWFFFFSFAKLSKHLCRVLKTQLRAPAAVIQDKKTEEEMWIKVMQRNK